MQTLTDLLEFRPERCFSVGSATELCVNLRSGELTLRHRDPEFLPKRPGVFSGEFRSHDPDLKKFAGQRRSMARLGVEAVWDVEDRLVSVKHPETGLLSILYDGMYSVAEVMFAACGRRICTEFSYAETMTEVVDMGGYTTIYHFDPGGRLVAITGPMGQRWLPA
uniref:Uncharacterized protein n=1 Tax=Streptomyces versipellis TaxID=67375 RepID=A0A0B6VSQ0_9ACTN|nr:hypothetical protein [Streptomyces versipellis]